MSGLLVKIALLAAMTHGLRALGRLAGPRRGGLVLGLPSTTAMVLIDCGRERGIGSAAVMAESSLLGLAAAVALPLAYAQALGQGWRLPWAPAAGIVAYATLALAFSILPVPGAVGCLAVATLILLAACHRASRIPAVDRGATRIASSRIRLLVLRTAVPAACFTAITVLRYAVGPRWAGLLGPFPGMTLTLLVVTQLESGSAEAGRMAKALIPGNWAMVAFLTAFRFGGPALGLGWGTASGYGLSVLVLLAVERLSRDSCWRATIERARSAWRPDTSWHPSSLAGAIRPFVTRRPRSAVPARVRRPGPRRRLMPRVEPIGL